MSNCSQMSNIKYNPYGLFGGALATPAPATVGALWRSRSTKLLAPPAPPAWALIFAVDKAGWLFATG
jgi:hypothetical protein